MKIVKKKVHIVPIGYDIERVTEPIFLEENGAADLVYLLTHDEVLERKEKRAHHCLQEARKILETRVPKVDPISVGSKEDFFDLQTMMSKMCFLIRKEIEVDKNDVYVNISTGSKISAVAGTLACLMYGGTPYYVRPEKYSEEKYGRDCSFYNSKNGICDYNDGASDHKKYPPLSIGLRPESGTIKELKNFDIKPLEDKFISTLKIIDEYPAGTTQENIIYSLAKDNICDDQDRKAIDELRGKREKERKKEFGKIRSRFRREYFVRLKKKNLIRNEGNNRNPKWSITEMGSFLLNILDEGNECVKK